MSNKHHNENSATYEKQQLAPQIVAFQHHISAGQLHEFLTFISDKNHRVLWLKNEKSPARPNYDMAYEQLWENTVFLPQESRRFTTTHFFDAYEWVFVEDQTKANLLIDNSIDDFFLWYQQLLEKPQIPEMIGLVLAGGQSLRMGTDKAALVYDREPMAKIQVKLLQNACSQVFVSVKSKKDWLDEHIQIEDQMLNLGPLSGLLTAFMRFPTSALCVLACDLPLFDLEALQNLCKHRDPSKYATAYLSPLDQMPEPLACIWEPKAFGVLLNLLKWGYSCPRKLLLNFPISSVICENSQALYNVNTPEEKDQIFKKIK